jgi:hypothetical protein
MVARLAREHGVEAAIRYAQASFPEAPPLQPVTVQHWVEHLSSWEERITGGMSIEKAVKEPYRKTKPRKNEVPESVKEEVAERIRADVADFGETTTDAVRNMFFAAGCTIGDSTLYRFRHEMAYSLLTVNPRRSADLDHEPEIKADILRFFDMIERHRKSGIECKNIISWDENPMWAERHKGNIWRPKGSGPEYYTSGAKGKRNSETQ